MLGCARRRGAREVPAPRRYDPEVLRRAVELVKSSGRPVAHIAAELGIGSESLRKAVRAAEAESGERPDLPTKEELAEIRRLRRDNEERRRTNEDPPAGECVFRPGARPGAAQRDVAVTSVEDHRDRFAVGLLCRAVGLRASTYYDSRPGGPRSRPSARAVADAGLLERIEAIHERSRGTYGSPRVHAQLALNGHRVGRTRVERLGARVRPAGCVPAPALAHHRRRPGRHVGAGPGREKLHR